MNNLEMMRKRFEFQGGIRQEDRMIKGKWCTLQKALQYSYQGCNVMLAQRHDECLNKDALENDDIMSAPQIWRALINPDKSKQDYDDKIISIDYNSQFGPGDVFGWIMDDLDEQRNQQITHWIIYLEELTEDAYFRGEIRRCKYQIYFKDEDGNEWSTWAAIRGPVETQIDSIQKNQIRLDRPNLSLNILLPNNPHTIKAFDRYKEFMFADRCWRVEAPDSISMTNIIEVNAEEYFKDRDTDTDELKNGLVIKPVIEDNSPILGEMFIKPMITEEYSAPEPGGKWCIVEKNMPIELKLKTDSIVKLTWDKTTSGKFTLRWSKGNKVYKKTIVVESLL